MPLPPTNPRSSPSGSGVIEIVVDREPVIALTPLDHRVRVGLVMPGLARVIDVSVQPSTACRALDEAARNARLDASSVAESTREAITAAVQVSEAWNPTPEVSLAGWFGGISFPLLGAAYDEGAAPVAEVPRWAEQILGARSFGQGAVLAFGRRATRPVKRALVEAVRPLPTGQISLGVLALALMGREVLQPDRIAKVLSCDRTAHPAADLPDPSTIDSARRVFNYWGDLRTERVLTEAAARPDGLAVLMKSVGYALQLGDHGPTGRLPNRLSELHDTYRVLVPSATERPAPTPRRCGPSGTRANQRRTDGRIQDRPAHHPVLAPPSMPVAAVRVPSERRIAMPSNIRALDGTACGDLVFVVPRTVGDLTRWGRLLSNCLGDFGPSVEAGRSVIIGVERERRLTYAIEITDSGNIRQFNGRANRLPGDQDRRNVLLALVRASAINPMSRTNRRWLGDLID